MCPPRWVGVIIAFPLELILIRHTMILEVYESLGVCMKNTLLDLLEMRAFDVWKGWLYCIEFCKP